MPEVFERKFKCIVEEDEMDHIIIKTIENEQSFHISKTVTPETVRIKVEYTKNTLKHAYYLANKETMAIKDDLSFMIAIIFLRLYQRRLYPLTSNKQYILYISQNQLFCLMFA